MSLINEALKKAQGQHQPTGPTRPSGPPVPPQGEEPAASHPQNRRHRSFLWGFIFAILVVGFVSILLATFLVWQIIGPEEKPPARPQAAMESEPVPIPEVVSPKENRVPDLDPAPDTVSIPAPAQAMAEAGKSTLPPASVPDTMNVQETTALPETGGFPQIVPAPEASAAPAARTVPPDPEVMDRLRDLEIRGIMSGNAKVLIQDLTTGRTKAYQAGDPLEGSLGLIVESINSNSIKFKDYAGSIHSKSF